MSWRRLLPFVLVGLLGVAVAAAAALGAAEFPRVRVLSPEAQSRLFHADVARTLASKSLTVRFAGQTTEYQAPNRTQAVESGPGSFGAGMSSVSIGSTSYVDFEGHWVKAPIPSAGLGTAPQVLSYLRALSSFRSAQLSGDTFTVHGTLSDLPKALVTLILTVVTHGPNGETETSFGTSYPNQRAMVVGRVVVDNGRVVAETFTALAAYPSRRRGSPSPTGTITYAHFDSSPAIAGPTKAELAPPCGGGTNGSCQVTTKGVAPNSPLCRAIRADMPKAGGAGALAQLQGAATSGHWSTIRTAMLEYFEQAGSHSRAVGRALKTAPSNIQAAAREGVRFLHAEKAALRKAKSSAQFTALSSHLFGQWSEAIGVLAQYEGTRCGTTTTYSGGTQSGGEQAFISTP